MWEQVTEWLNNFFNQPIVINLTTVASLAAVVLTIFSKTSVGRKAISKLTNLYTQGVEIAQQTSKKVKDVELLAEQRISELTKEYEEKITALISIVNFYEESVFTLLENVPNAKVQAALSDFKLLYEDKKKEINKWVTITYQDYKAKVEEEVKKIEEEKDLKIALLTNEIENLKKIIEPLLNVKEDGENGQQTEEDKDTNPD